MISVWVTPPLNADTPLVCECVHDWLNERRLFSALRFSEDVISAVHLRRLFTGLMWTSLQLFRTILDYQLSPFLYLCCEHFALNFVIYCGQHYHSGFFYLVLAVSVLQSYADDGPLKSGSALGFYPQGSCFFFTGNYRTFTAPGAELVCLSLFLPVLWYVFLLWFSQIQKWIDWWNLLGFFFVFLCQLVIEWVSKPTEFQINGADLPA